VLQLQRANFRDGKRIYRKDGLQHHDGCQAACLGDGRAAQHSNPGAAFYPGLPPSQSNVNYNKGIVVNYNGVITSNLINNFVCFVRQSVGYIGNSNQDWILLRGLNDQTGPRRQSRARMASNGRRTFSRTTCLGCAASILAVWRAGRVYPDTSISYASSFSFARANASWTTTSGYAQELSPLNPMNSGSRKWMRVFPTPMIFRSGVAGHGDGGGRTV